MRRKNKNGRKQTAKACKRKTERGNVYKSLKEAAQAADNMRKKKKTITIYPYKCPNCRKYHIGNWGLRKEN